MKIKIETEKVVEKGVMMRKILGIEAQRAPELPREYLKEGTHVYLKHEDAVLHISNGPDMIIKETYPEQVFQQQLAYIRDAGERLVEINRRIEQLKDTWHGVETYII